MTRHSPAQDPESLDRFVAAQDRVYAVALSELERGRKESHWMWFIFPQLRGLGQSAMSHLYGIADREEARRYLTHPLLGPRLVACAQAVLAHDDRSAEAIFGTIDAGKLRSSATLFAVHGPAVFTTILDTFFDGRPCPVTARRLHA
ncbi:DUF1810 domain-containing protein [Paracoccus marcusii]|uniref:DUF1810 domain-containing protein n=1 Tax=Paracoccus marcusii TaxID=59779 RepID=UPI0035A71AB6